MIVWSKLSPQKPYYLKACKMVSELSYKKELLLCDSSVNKRFFVSMKKAQIAHNLMIFLNCQMGDGLPQKLSII